VPIILCSGNNEQVSLVKIKEAGITELATKPLNKKEFSEMVRKTLDRNKC
jgi:PleD family two-component response regulator